MAGHNRWNMKGWGHAQQQIRDAIEFLCEGKDRQQCAEIAYDIGSLARAIALGSEPIVHADPLTQRDDHEREAWAKACASHVVGAALGISERGASGRLPSDDQIMLLRKVAEHALWHMPNAAREARQLAHRMDIEGLKRPHPGDDPAPEI